MSAAAAAIGVTSSATAATTPALIRLNFIDPSPPWGFASLRVEFESRNRRGLARCHDPNHAAWLRKHATRGLRRRMRQSHCCRAGTLMVNEDRTRIVNAR